MSEKEFFIRTVVDLLEQPTWWTRPRFSLGDLSGVGLIAMCLAAIGRGWFWLW